MIFCGVDAYFLWEKRGPENFAAQKGGPDFFFQAENCLHMPL